MQWSNISLGETGLKLQLFHFHFQNSNFILLLFYVRLYYMVNIWQLDQDRALYSGDEPDPVCALLFNQMSLDG